MEIEQIIDKWKSFGWNSSQDYHKWTLDTHLRSFHEENVGDIFDADLIDVKKFWKATDIHFSTDTVCNSDVEGGVPLTIYQSNKANHSIPLFLGLLGNMEFAMFNSKRMFNSINIAEIGCGYGSFEENFVNQRNDIDSYVGFDIIPRTESSVELEGTNGSFSDEQVEKYKEKFNIFYSSNVFQHLSEKQIDKYLEQVYDMLPENGFFLFTYVHGVKNTYHYGQCINIVPYNDMLEKIKNAGFHTWYTSTQNSRRLNPVSFCVQKQSLLKK